MYYLVITTTILTGLNVPRLKRLSHFTSRELWAGETLQDSRIKFSLAGENNFAVLSILSKLI